MFARTALLLPLLALTAACGPTEVDTDSATEAPGSSSTGDATDSDPTGSATEVEPTTGETEFPMCQEPLAAMDIGFTLESATLETFDPIDVQCDVVGSENGPSLAIELTCTDADAVEHAVHLELKLFPDAAPLALLNGATKVRLVHYQVDDFTVRDILALRGPADELLVFAGSGYSVFNADDVALRAPLTFAPVAEELCVTEILDVCDHRRRSALDISLADIEERVFDRDEATLAGFAVHLGEAVEIDRYAGGDECFGDSIDGLETRIVVYATAE